MKLALLLPGYIESPDYQHLVIIDEHLKNLGFTTIRIDACNLWTTGNGNNYSTSKYIEQVQNIINSYLPQKPTEIVLIGHSLGCLVALHIAKDCDAVTKIVCLSPPVILDKSDHKWINGFRVSKKDLPNNLNEFRTFSVPDSFIKDRKQYSIVNSLNNFTKLFIFIIGQDDLMLSDVKKVVIDKNIDNFVIIPNMGHDFRQSAELCKKVASEVEKFIEN